MRWVEVVKTFCRTIGVESCSETCDNKFYYQNERALYVEEEWKLPYLGVGIGLFLNVIVESGRDGDE